jgi:hypothetical protein
MREGLNSSIGYSKNLNIALVGAGEGDIGEIMGYAEVDRGMCEIFTTYFTRESRNCSPTSLLIHPQHVV